MQESETLRSGVDSASNMTEKKPRGIFEWIEYYHKNKPQTNALGAGLMVVLYGGMHLGWGIFNNHIQAQGKVGLESFRSKVAMIQARNGFKNGFSLFSFPAWAGGYEDAGTVFWIIISWFIASIVGFLLATLLVPKYSKMTIYVSKTESFDSPKSQETF